MLALIVLGPKQALHNQEIFFMPNSSGNSDIKQNKSITRYVNLNLVQYYSFLILYKFWYTSAIFLRNNSDQFHFLKHIWMSTCVCMYVYFLK